MQNVIERPNNAASTHMKLHCGAEWTTLENIRNIPTPKPVGKHYPTNFGFFADSTRERLVQQGYELGSEAWSTSHENQRLFGVIEANLKPDPAKRVGEIVSVVLDTSPGATSYMAKLVEHQSTENSPEDWRDGYTFWKADIAEGQFKGMRLLCYVADDAIAAPKGLTHLVGIRSSHDQSFSNQLVMGTRVFVCDNLAFNGQIVIRRKNTRNAEAQLPGLLDRAVSHIHETQQTENLRTERLRNHTIRDTIAESQVIRALEAGIIAGRKWEDVLSEYRNPSVQHDGGGNTAWGLKQAFTHVFKQYSLDSVVHRSLNLTAQLDKLIGFTPAKESGIIDID